MKVLKEFRDFAVKGNVVDMAVGIIIGGAFGTIVSSMVNDVIMPPIGILIGGVDFSEIRILIKEATEVAASASDAEKKAAQAVYLNIGKFINNVFTFTIVAFAVFMLVKATNTLKRKQVAAPAAAPTTKECSHCATTIPLAAKRCPNCTSQL